MENINNLVYGYIVGDAFGLSILHNKYDNSIKLRFNESLNIEKGSFSSMTTFMLSMMDSLSSSNNDVFDVMNKMCTSLIVGKYTNDGRVYDIDNNTLNILTYFSKKNNFNYNIEDNFSAYSISRVLPFAINNFYKEDNLEDFRNNLFLTSENEIVHLGCYIYYKYIMNLMEGCNKYKSLLKIKIPDSFTNNSIKYYKNLLKGNVFYKDIVFNDNIVNVLNIMFYVVLSSDSFIDMLNMINNLEGNTNIYSSLICSVGGILYGKKNIPSNLIKDLKNKKDINKYIKKFERMFL